MQARDPILVEHEKTHGSFAHTAKLAQMLKSTFRLSKGYPNNERHREALDQIATKLARILCGDSNSTEHWEDIAGYTNLAIEYCNELPRGHNTKQRNQNTLEE